MSDVDPHDDLLWNVVAFWDSVGSGEDEGEDVERGAGSFPTETLAELWGRRNSYATVLTVPSIQTHEHTVQ